MLINSIKDYMYDRLLGTSLDIGNACTASLYAQALEQIPDGSRVLDVGIGNGTSTITNLQTIRQKNIKIDGIDIDPDYIAIANQKILIANASDCITAKNINLLEIYGDKWDYIFFSESYPVIKPELMTVLWNYSQNLLNPGGKIVMTHNLCDHPNFLFKFLKKNVKYITMVDFGRTTSMREFVSHLEKSNLKIKSKKVLFPMMMGSFPGHIRGSFLANMLALATGTSYGSEWRNNNQWFFELEKII